MEITYELNSVERALLSSMAMVSWSSIPEPIACDAARLVLTSGFDYTKLVDAATTGRHKWPPDTGKQLELDRAIAALVALRLIERTRKETIARSIMKVHSWLFARAMTRALEAVEPAFELTLTSEGERIATAILEGRAAQLRPPHDLRRTVFVASAFGRPELERLYEKELAPACKALALVPVRVDLTEPRQTITARILDGIRDCRLMIADLTYARQSVYFEVGVAHGLGIPLVLTCREDHLRNDDDAQRLHFDLAQYKISFWQEGTGQGFQWPERMSPLDRLRIAEDQLHALSN